MISISVMRSAQTEPTKDIWIARVDGTSLRLTVHSEPGKEPSYDQVETKLREELGIFEKRELREELIINIARVRQHKPSEQELARVAKQRPLYFALDYVVFERLKP